MRIRAIALGIVLGLFIGGGANANPTNPQVVHGQVGFANPVANTLEITNSPGAIVNWGSFGKNANEITRFIQQGPNSAILNRVIGQNPSNLLGQLPSNGRVYLINPNWHRSGVSTQWSTRPVFLPRLWI